MTDIPIDWTDLISFVLGLIGGYTIRINIRSKKSKSTVVQKDIAAGGDVVAGDKKSER